MATIFTICTIFTRFGCKSGNPHKIRLFGHFCGLFKVPKVRTLGTNLSNSGYQKFELRVPKVRSGCTRTAGCQFVETVCYTAFSKHASKYQFVERTDFSFNGT